MDCSTPGFPVLLYLQEFAQTHVPWVNDATQPSHHLSPPSPLALNLSQHQGLFQWVGSSYKFSSVQSLRHVQLSATPWPAAHQASPSITNSQGLLKLMYTESVMPSNHPILCHPHASCLQPFPVLEKDPPRWVNSLHQMAKILELQLQHQSFQCIFRVYFLRDWLVYLLAKGLSRVFPAPQFGRINSLVLSLLYGPTLTSIQDYWKNHSFD